MYQAIAYHQSLPEGRRAGILRSGKEGSPSLPRIASS